MGENFFRVKGTWRPRADHNHAAANIDAVSDDIMTDRYSPL